MKSITEIRAEKNRTVGDYLLVENDRFYCAKCNYEIGNVENGIKSNLALRERPVEGLGKNWIDPGLLLDEDIVFREYMCPECATRIATESCRRDDPVIEEIRLDPDSM